MSPAISSRPPRVAVIGAGRAGGTLGVLLAEAGWPVLTVWSRRPGRGRTVARRIAARSRSTPRATTVLQASMLEADCLLIAVPDHALEITAEGLAGLGAPSRGVALHLSGSRDAEALAALRGVGAQIGACHPLAVLPAGEPPTDLLADTLFAHDGDRLARSMARRLARALHGRPVHLAAQARVPYHLAASMVANDTVALFQMALELAQDCGLGERTARRGLARLLEGTAAALLREQPATALTGPVSRGDRETLRRHLDVAPPASARVHRLLSMELLRLVRRRGRLPESDLAAMARVLSPTTIKK